jgi:Protein of unknown function (DUF3300)
MSSKSIRSRSWQQILSGLLAICSISLLGPGTDAVLAQEKPKAADSAAAQADAKRPPEQLDALVAPIALYPDPLLAQTLVASTYPLELVQLHQWLAKHPKLKDKALADSVAKQPWDPSIQSMAAVPEVVKRLSDDIQWTTDLGNAFLAQQGDVMDAVQRMRAKAKANGALESNEQQKVETKTVEEKTVIVVEQTNPEVIYVPSYSPTYVYGPPIYPYPPIYYPPYTPGAAFVSFSFGFMMGAAIWGGSCCYAGWGGSNNIIINNNNNFNQINHNRGGAGSGNWQHSPSHRGGTPYGDRATASKYGGSGAGVSNRAAGGAGVSDRAGGTQGQRSPNVSDRSASGAGNRSGAGGAGGADRVGSRDIPKSSGSRSSAWSGGSGGYSGSSARASSSRGASSMGSRGGSRGGGGRRR